MRSLVAALLLLAAPLAAEPGKLVIGSKAFAENRILAEVLAQLVEANTELVVERRANLGGTMVVHAALTSGEIDVYPEYSGTGWAVVLGRKDTRPPLETFVTVDRVYREEHGLTWLAPFGFNNSYAIVLHADTAKRLKVTRISELAPHLAELRFGLGHEFIQREDGWLGLARTYGFSPDLNPTGMEHGLAYEAILSGRVDIVDGYTTDGKLLEFPIVMLEDDAGFFPPYQCAPVIRTAILDKHPKLRPLFERLAFRLPDRRMQALNAAVEVDGRSFANVARAFLIEEKLLGAAAPVAKAVPEQSQLSSVPIGKLLGQHVLLTFIALLLATLFGVPMGLFLTRAPKLAGPVIGATGVIQTIPSLALLAFMIPIPGLGIGSRSAVVALFLYALLPIVRNTYTGIISVDKDLKEAARGMGLTDLQRLTLVELPLASRTIMAGIRTSTIIGIGVATLAAFIGAGGLGDPIITGLQLNDTALVLSGAIPAALLAIATDLVLGFLEKRLTPDP